MRALNTISRQSQSSGRLKLTKQENAKTPKPGKWKSQHLATSENKIVGCAAPFVEQLLSQSTSNPFPAK